MSDPIEPPHSAEAERAVLGCILLDTTGCDGDRVWDICQERGLVPDAFFEPRNATVYREMTALTSVGKPLDIVTLLEALRTNGTLDGIGGAEYLQSLFDQTPTTAHAEYYIDIVRNKHLRRKIIERGTSIVHSGYDEDGHPDVISVLAEAEKSILDLDTHCGDSSTTIMQDVQKVVAELNQILDGDADKTVGIPTGFAKLDDVVDGLKNGEMVVIGARPSEGKTSLAANIAENVASNGIPVLFFSAEMKKDAILKRMVLGRSRINASKLHRRYMTTTQIAESKDKIAKAATEIEKLQIYIEDSTKDVCKIRAKARRMKKQHGIGMVVVDYLQECTCEAAKRLNGREREVAEISGQLKEMAKELDVPVIVPTQLNRSNEKEKGRNPRLSDLRDSGSIEQDADVVMLLRRPCRKNTGDTDMSMVSDETLAIIDVAKNRNGETGEVYMKFEKQYTKFSIRDQPSVR